MKAVSKDLVKYVEKNILPMFDKNDAGHRINHIEYVTERAMRFAKQFDNIDFDMLYVICAYHDVGHNIDKDKHEFISANIFYEDEFMKKYFNEEERIIIKEAIEDHRSTNNKEPRSDYGKIVSSAGRNTSIDSALRRCHEYNCKHFNYNLNDEMECVYSYIKRKFGENGYAKTYVKDEEFDEFKKEIKKLIDDKIHFYSKYLSIIDFDKSYEVEDFVKKAHAGQVRKNEVDKPMIIHPIGVARLLKEYGFDFNVCCAGYLHDVVEDTEYTIDDIKVKFGEDVAYLVSCATEPPKSLSWEDRKQRMIDKTKTLPLRAKAVICADKINNLEDLEIKFLKTGKRDFSLFNRGEDKQKWYYISMYESLIENEDKNLPMFKRYLELLETIFLGYEDIYFQKDMFEDDEYYKKLKMLHGKKQELYKLKDFVKSSNPFIIEFLGTPRAGKTSTINSLYEFFKKGGFKVSVIEELTTSKRYKETIKSKLDKYSLKDKLSAIQKYTYYSALEAFESNKDIILIDRSINDRMIWNYRAFKTGRITKEEYYELCEEIKSFKKLINYLVCMYTDAEISLSRDYEGSLCLEDRSFLNIKNISEYNFGLKDIQDKFKENVDSVFILDTATISSRDSSIIVANEICDNMRSRSIKALNKKYK